MVSWLLLRENAMWKNRLIGVCILVGMAGTSALTFPPASHVYPHRPTVDSSWLPPVEPIKPAINEVNFNKIETGMTAKEVEAILGAPPGVYTAQDTYYYTPPMPSMGLRWKKTVKDCLRDEQMFPCDGRKTWYGDAAFITIYFDSTSRVKEHGYAGGKYFDRGYLVTAPDPSKSPTFLHWGIVQD
jgi:hypothetical protein